MPSYYDSTKKKPGTAKVKYNEGGKVKKMKEGGTTTVVGVENGHDVTLARGSGAARPQKFHKNG